MSDKAPTLQKFPRTFWTANVTELFERGAYYAMASFVVVYLGQLGMGKTIPSNLNGMLLWGLVYFLPILSGTIADQVGFKKALLTAFVLLSGGYFLMGYPVWFGGYAFSDVIKDEVTADSNLFAIVIGAIVLIGMGGSIIKPCISGTVQKTAGVIGRATLGFGIFYMVINIGSLFGRGTAFAVRKQLGLSYIFAVSIVCCIVAFFVVLLFYRDPEREGGEAGSKARKPLGRILKDMFLVLRNVRFILFLLASSGFFFIYAQVYNVIPLYLKRVVDLDPPMDVITMANPFVIVTMQLLVTRLFGKWKPINSIVFGTVVLGIAMTLNLVPVFSEGGIRASFAGWVPIAFVFAAITVGLIAVGELFSAARTYEYIGALAPKGQEGLFLGYANLPMAIGAIVGGPIGAVIFNDIMCRGSKTLPSGLLELDPFWNSMGWVVLMGIGFASALAMWLYNFWLKRHPA
ncbi:MAG: MFS transporter [Deltaproteobacteria bacterium]|nr:MFS transporter [Deltaproteobacteria bacterium]